MGYLLPAVGRVSRPPKLLYVAELILSTIAFSLVAEMSTRRLQIKTVAMGRAAYNVAAIIVNVLTPYMLNPTAWDWGNYAGFFWAGT